MLLTDAEKAEADRLRLTYTEYVVALKTHIAPEVYAKHKAAMQAERDEWEQRMSGVSDAMLERARYMPKGRGERPATDALSNGEGG